MLVLVYAGADEVRISSLGCGSLGGLCAKALVSGWQIGRYLQSWLRPSAGRTACVWTKLEVFSMGRLRVKNHIEMTFQAVIL